MAKWKLPTNYDPNDTVVVHVPRGLIRFVAWALGLINVKDAWQDESDYYTAQQAVLKMKEDLVND